MKVPKKNSKLVILITFVVVTLALIQLFISYNLANTGEKVNWLEKKTSQLEKENRILVEEISQIRSLSKISSEASKLGLVRTTQVLHLTPQMPVALK